MRLCLRVLIGFGSQNAQRMRARSGLRLDFCICGFMDFWGVAVAAVLRGEARDLNRVHRASLSIITRACHCASVSPALCFH